VKGLPREDRHIKSKPKANTSFHINIYQISNQEERAKTKNQGIDKYFLQKPNDRLYNGDEMRVVM
jgi:hypothetical protein